MAVSNAFEELSAVLGRLEAAEADVRSIRVREPDIEPGGDMKAELTVAVPLFAASVLRDGVTIEAENADVQGQRVSVDLTVTVPVSDEEPVDAVPGLANQSNTITSSDSTPPYKDPDALATAYAKCDTFPEMTAALGVDVTSETVRRHAVKYGIHDPDDSAPQTGHDIGPGKRPDTETSDDQIETNPTTADKTTTADGLESSDNGDDEPQGDGAPNQAGESPTSKSETSGPDHSEQMEDGHETSDVSASPFADRPIAEFPSETDTEQENPVVTDGIGVDSDLTVGELTIAINRSDTVHEVKQHLDMSRDKTRQLLQRLDLIQFVSHPLASNQLEITPAEVVRRIDPERE
jgi:hypothetical protein